MVVKRDLPENVCSGRSLFCMEDKNQMDFRLLVKGIPSCYDTKERKLIYYWRRGV